MIKVIKTQAEYEAALAMAEELVSKDPAAGSKEAERLELLAVLLEDYETKQVRIALPSPLNAIRFRMEQGRLTQKDLIPFIGSRSKVSEVLSGKRPLTLPMIRALSAGLGIPAEILVQDAVATLDEDIEWARFPVAEMLRRGWLTTTASANELVKHPKEALSEYFQPVGAPQQLAVLFRRAAHVRGGRDMDRYALVAWSARVVRQAMEIVDLPAYSAEQLTARFFSDLVRLSPFDDGPLRARQFLKEHGIPLIIEQQLPGTSLDGAAILLPSRRPVIGLTIRHDRVDNFWFSLFHELAHACLHLGNSADSGNDFFDNLEVGPGEDFREVEADDFAGDNLIAPREWRASAASKVRAIPAALQLANRLSIHPAIVAGRMRHQYKDYRVLTTLIGQGEVRRLFRDVNWFTK